MAVIDKTAVPRDESSAESAPAAGKLTTLHLLKTSVGASWALRQMRELVKLGAAVHVALPAGGPLIPRYDAAGVQIHLLQTDFPLRRPWEAPKACRTLRQLVTSIQPDLIHSHFVGTTLTMRLALGRRHPIPRVFQVPGPLHLEHFFFRASELATAGRSDYWMGSCRWTCDRYRASGVETERLFLSYYGIDTESFVPRAPGKLRRELGLPAASKIVGMVAYMYAPKRYLGQTRGLKGHEDLIDAIAICAERDPAVTCVMVGGAWNEATAYERRVRDYAREKCGDRVIFLGTRSDVADLYPDIDVVAHPSHSENVGGAAESLLLSVPTVATNVGGFPDLVKPGETGWLVPPKDPPALAAAIMEALENPEKARAMAARGRELAHSLFDVRRSAADVMAAYEAILRRPREAGA